MCRPTNLGTFKVPTYALALLISGDASGMTDAEIVEIDDAIAREFPQFESLSFDYDPDEFFSNNPLFGLPAMVCECAIYGHLQEVAA